nr:hypothetical protein BaRGS_019214 [Batillaria attramentaria]
MILSSDQKAKLRINGEYLQADDNPTYLGVTFDKRLTWKQQTEKAATRAKLRLNIMKKLAGTTWGADMTTLKRLYTGANINPTSVGTTTSPPRLQYRDVIVLTRSDEVREETRDVREKIDTIKREVDEVKGVVFELREENETLKRELSGRQKVIDELKDQCQEAKHEAAVARKKGEALEQYTRRNDVRIFGMSEEERETAATCEGKVLDIVKNKLGLRNTKTENLEIAHRIGRRERPEDSDDDDDEDNARPRPIIARFVSRRSLQAVFQNRKKKKTTGALV